MIATLIQLFMFITPVISALTLAMKREEVKRAGDSVAWPAVKAKIIDVKLVPTGKKYKGQPLYRLDVTVKYRFEEQTYTARLNPADDTGLAEGPKQWGRDLALKYRPDTAVRLYVNPKRPKQATLQPGVTTVSSARWMIIGGVMLFFSFILHLLSVLALSQRFFSLSSTTGFVLAMITFTVMLMLGVLIFMLIQETTSQQKA